jgi:glutamine amidotransferase/cyclase
VYVSVLNALPHMHVRGHFALCYAVLCTLTHARCAVLCCAVLCRSGADKVSIGSDAVEAAEQYYASGCKLSGNTAIEEISRVYGKQAVVVSIDPRRVYVSDPSETTHTCVKASKPGPNGERWCWWQCTVKGGREGRDIDAVQVRAVWRLASCSHVLGCGRHQDGA